MAISNPDKLITGAPFLVRSYMNTMLSYEKIKCLTILNTT